jgi:hypothetical protein
LFEKLLADGIGNQWEIDTEAVHTDAPAASGSSASRRMPVPLRRSTPPCATL